MFCEHCGDENGEETGVDHDERDCPWNADDGSIVITSGDLAEIVQSSAEGCPALSAATDLLIDHGHWIARLAEKPRLLLIDYEGGTPEPYGIDWPQVADALRANEIPGSSGELSILAIAASLADNTASVCLGDAIGGLDATNLDRVLKAISRANGRQLA